VALEAALAACEIGAGHEVVVTPRSFIASVSAVVRAGAESTLAFLLALSEMKALQNTLASFKEPADLQDEAAIGPPVSPEASGKQLT
jgi:hypothetical protein